MIQNEPLVSVLMTAYNREQFIGEAIESVLASTYHNFELIIVDDNSSDNTLTIANTYAARDKRIKVYKNEINLGDYPNRKKASSYARGKYLKYFDSDDIMYPHCIEVMVSGMEKFPEAALGMVWGEPVKEPSPHLFTSYEAYHTYFFSNKWMQVGPSGAIYKREAFLQVDGFDTLPLVGDFDLNLKLAARWPVVRLQTDLFFYRIHPEQELSIGNKTGAYDIFTYLVQKRHLESKYCPLYKHEIKAAMRMINKLQARRALMGMLRTGRYQHLRKLVEDSGLGWHNFFKGLITFK